MNGRPFSRLRTVVLAVLAAGFGLLGGCMAGPDFERPAPPRADHYTAQPLPGTLGTGKDAQHLVPGMDVPAEWWTLFRSTPLNALITQALGANPGLAAARAALRQAQELAAAQQGSLFPGAGVDYQATRERNPATLASPLASGAGYFTLHTAQLSVSYAPDVFGGGRRELESLRAQADVARFELEAARQSLASNVVVAAVNVAGLRAEIAAARSLIAGQRQMLASLQRQLALGAVSEAAVALQRAALAQADAGLPPLRRQLEQQRDALAALLGEPPANAPAAQFKLADLHLPSELPLSLPARLVDRRPDVRAAEAQLRAASAQVGVALANRLPKFALSAGAGSAATNMAGLFAHGTAFWNLAADIAEPIFDAGALKHQQRAAEAAFDAAKAQYRATVIGALQNVADALYALQGDADALGAARAARTAARRSLAIARQQFKLGDADYLAVLQAEQAEQQATGALIAAEVERYNDTAALFLALGGGWRGAQASTALRP